MLYVGASLMIGASIYGFVDYKQTQNKKAFTDMYREVKNEPVISEVPTVAVVEKKETTPVTTTVTTAKKNRAKKAAVTDVEPVIKPISEDEMIDRKETKSIAESKVEVKTSPVPTEKKIKKKKKLNHKIFSRAPLREEMEEDDVTIVADKKAEEKTGVKEQAPE